MKTRSYVLSLAILIITVACAKQEAANPGGGASSAQPPPCTPDGLGQVPSGCPVPATSNVRLNGDLIQTSEYATLQLLKDNAGRLERPWNYNFGGGGFYSTIRCQSGDGIIGFVTGKTCERECKNYRYGAEIQVEIFSGNGIVRIKNGPYHAPGACDRSLNGSFYTIQIPVWIYNDSDGSGFSIKSANTYPMNREFSIEVAEGSATNSQATTFIGDVFYRGSFLGKVQLYRRN